MNTKTTFGEEIDLIGLEAASGGIALGLLPAVVAQRNLNAAPEPDGGLIGWRSTPEPDHTALYVNAAVQVFQGVMRAYAQGGGFQSQGYGYADYPQATYGADNYDAYGSGYDYGSYDGYSDGGYGLTGV